MTKLTNRLAHSIFQPLAAATRPFGGLRPHRWMHWLGKLAAGSNPPGADQFQWYRDRHGNRMRLHPYYLIDRHIIAFGEYEAPLQRFLSRHIRPGMCCLDVGANLGAVAIPLAKLCGPDGRVLAFEPNPEVAVRLSEHIAGNSLKNVELISAALSDVEGTLALAIASQSHENQGMSSLVEFSHADLKHSVTVPVTTLDHFVSLRQLERIDFVKVDIQGAEPLFLRGARQSLKRFRPMIAMELAASSLAETNTLAADLVRTLEEMGLSGHELRPDGSLGPRLMADHLAADFAVDNAIFMPA